jgi:hypothetical protein
VLLSFVAGAGCAGSTGSAPTGTTSASSSASCKATSTTTLAGAHIEIDASHCTFSLSHPAKISFPYKVVIDQHIAGVVPRAQDAGGCGRPGASGLITFEKVDGNRQNYCICDTGLCPPPKDTPVTLPKGSYPGTFTWDKRNWDGPSDTARPEGPPFPAGDYTVTVSAVGTQLVAGKQVEFVVKGTLQIHLVP